MCCQGKQLQHGNTSGSSFQKYNTAAYWNLYRPTRTDPDLQRDGRSEWHGGDIYPTYLSWDNK